MTTTFDNYKHKTKQMRKTICLLFIFMFCFRALYSQQVDSIESKKLDNLRTESGVDPTRVSSRVNFTFEFIDPQGPGYSFNTVLKANVGIAKWSFALKTKIKSTYQGNSGPGEMMKKGFDDLTFSIGNTVFYKGRHAINIGADLVAPIGSSDFSGQAFLFTPNFTYAVTISPEFIFAINPQYSMTVVRTENVQRVSLLTVRPFLQHFYQADGLGL